MKLFILIGNQEEISLLNFLYTSKIDETNPIELIDINQNINLNIESIISKNLLCESFANTSKIANPIFSIDLDKLYKEYFSGEFKEFKILKLEKMFNDFKIILILINNYKKRAEIIVDQEKTKKFLAIQQR